jgi:membrane protein implicated in regulation of membrane protease activity
MARMTPVALRYRLIRILADGLGAGLALALFMLLPFGALANMALSALAFIVTGVLTDRWYRARLTPDQRAAEMQARADAGL